MLSDDDFAQLLAFLDRPWAGFRKVRKGVKKRVRRHMASVGCTTIEAYLRAIADRAEDRRHCEQALIVTISRFFRDRQLWQALKDQVLPGLIQRFDAPIRIWSAGCANGEEAYSLAITWDLLDHAPQVRILATDTGILPLERAKAGIYGQSSLKAVSDELLAGYFTPVHRRRMAVRHRKLAPIHWRRHDLFEPPPTGPHHLILVRNSLLTYHRGPPLVAALNRIVSALAPGGCLVVGAHERLPGLERPFVRAGCCPWVYRLE